MSLDRDPNGRIARIGGVGNFFLKKVKTRPYVIKAKDFTQSTQSEPIPVTWGSAERAGVYIFPIFKYRSKKLKQQAGK